MKNTPIAVCLLATALLCLGPATVQAQEDLQAQIQQIRQQLSEVDALKAKLAELEMKLDEIRKAQDAASPTVTTALKGSKLKIDARIFTGLFGSGDDGSYPNWSTDVKDAKLRLTYSPSKNITVVNRFSTSSAKTGDFDYFYLDYKGALSPTSILRLGQRKPDVGQETWVDNPVENMLLTTAVS